VILVVEDNVDDSFLLTRELARVDLANQVRVIGDGQDALEFLLRASPTPYAVFLDLNLPRLSGIELLRQIRQEPRLYTLPVIIMTNSIDPEDVEKCARLGVFAYLPKPIGLELFKKIIGCGNSKGSFLPRPIDPHFADLASPMLQKGT
jgi:two-component system, response regulator